MAEKSKSIEIPNSFAFSGCGWLVPFYFGVIQELTRQNLINDDTIFAGTSGGALAAVLGCCKVPPTKALDALIKVSRSPNFTRHIDQGLRESLLELLPPNAIDYCNGRLHITTTRLWPNPIRSPYIISQFSNLEQLVSAVTASCFIPFYSAPRQLVTSILQPSSSPSSLNQHPKQQEKEQLLGYFIDGGIFALMPPIGEIRISPLPPKYQLRSNIPVDITLPDDALLNHYSFAQLLIWVLIPAKETELRNLFHLGEEATATWIHNYRTGKVQLSKRQHPVVHTQQHQEQQDQINLTAMTNVLSSSTSTFNELHNLQQLIEKLKISQQKKAQQFQQYFLRQQLDLPFLQNNLKPFQDWKGKLQWSSSLNKFLRKFH
jgi:hypothetical protein